MEQQKLNRSENLAEMKAKNRKQAESYKKRFGVRCPFCNDGKTKDGETCTLFDGAVYIIESNKNKNYAFSRFERIKFGYGGKEIK